MVHWKTLPGPVKWCGAVFEEMPLGVCLQMVINGVHLQHKKDNLDGNDSLPLK